MKRTFRRNPRERGFAALAYALMILVILAFTGLAVDVGYLQWQKRQMQTATDAAAMGALRELELSNSDLIAAGQNDASLNGFTDGQNGTTVTINNPPASGSFAGKNTAVEAIIQRTYGTYFMRILGTNSVTVAARSVGETTTSYGSIGGCIFALNPTAKVALNVEGSLTLHTACSAVVESTDNEAFKMASASTWHMTSTHAQVGVVGPGGNGNGWWVGGSAQIWDDNKNKAENPVTITNPGDPFVNIKVPAASTVSGIQSPSPASYSKTSWPAGGVISPGIYCGGIYVGNTNNIALKLNPGTYVIAGGGFSLGSQAVITGTGVTIYNTDSTGWGCSSSYSYSPVSMVGGAAATLTAPTSTGTSAPGGVEGMLFFMNPSITDNSTNKIVGGSTSSFDGALYFKHGALQFAGNNSTTGYMVIVADTIDIQGDTTLGNNYTTLANPNPFAPATTGGGLVQ